MKIIKYFFIGGAAAVVDITLFTIFAKFLEYNYLLVGLLTFLLATAVNYVLSIRYVFKSASKHSKQKEIFLIYLVSSIGLGINLFVLFVAISIIELEMFFSKLLATSSVFFWNYYTRKYLIFGQDFIGDEHA